VTGYIKKTSEPGQEETDKDKMKKEEVKKEAKDVT
jgi:hypothetical protein